MTDTNTMTDTLFTTLWTVTWQSAMLAGIVWLVIALFGKWLQPRFRYLLWCIVLMRLMLPVLPTMPWTYPQIFVVPASVLTETVSVSVSVSEPQSLDCAEYVPQTNDYGSANVFSQESLPQRSETWELPPQEPFSPQATQRTASLAVLVDSVHWQAIALPLWLLGIALFGVRYARDEIRLYRRSRYWKTIDDPGIIALLERCRKELGIRQHVQLLAVPSGIGAAAMGLFRPKILLSEQATATGSEPLRMVLLHELIHIKRFDPLVLRLTAMLTLIHWFNPAVWLAASRLQRERELACDTAVLDRLGNQHRKEYGGVIVAFAELFSVQERLPGMVGVFYPNPISRRLDMIKSYRKSRFFSILFGGLLVLAVAGFGLMKAQTQSPAQNTESAAVPPQSTQTGTQSPALEAQPQTFDAQILDSKTQKPIAGVTVSVQCWHGDNMYDNPENCFAESFYTTDADGKYRFSITAEQAAEKDLYLKVMTDHPDYMGAGFAFQSYQSAVFSSANEVGAGRFGNFILEPAVQVFGRIVDPDGKPVSPCNVNVFWEAYDDYYSDRFYRNTNREGKFSSKVEPGKGGVVKIIPRDFAPKTVYFTAEQAGDLGTIQVERGMILSGKTVDAEGKPLGNVRVNVQERPDDADRFFPQCLTWRTTDSDAEGNFKTRPLMPGHYQIAALPYTMELPYHDVDINNNLDGFITREDMKKAKDIPFPERLPVPGIFFGQTVDFKGEPIEYRAAKTHTISFRCLDESGKSFGKPVRILIFGKVDGETWENPKSSVDVVPDDGGNLSVQVPQGLTDTVLFVLIGETPISRGDTPIRYRLGKDAPMKNDWVIDFGTIDKDISGVEVYPYKAGRVTIYAKDTQGQYFDDYRWYPSMKYENKELYDDNAGRFRGFMLGIGKLGPDMDITSTRNEAGKEVPARAYSVWTLADEPFDLNVRLKQENLDTRTLKLAAGEEKTVTFTLERDGGDGE